MGLLEAVGKAVTKAPGSVPGGLAITPQSLSPSKGAGTPKEQLARYRGWVFAAASVRARAVAAVTMHLMNGEDEIESHPFLDLWKRPAPGYFGSTWRQVFYLHLYLTGNHYSFIGQDRFNVPRMLLPLRPDRVAVVPGKDVLIDHYELTADNGLVVEIAPEFILHAKLPNPHNPFYGMGIVEAAAAAIDISEYGHAYANATFRNHSVPAAWIKMSADTPQGDRRKLARLIMDQFKGVANGNRTLVTGDAIESITPLQTSPADLEFLNGMKFSRDETFALFGVHRSMVGMADDINLANAQAGEYTFAKWVVTPDIDVLQNALDFDILPRYDTKLSVNFDDPVPIDESRKGNNAQVAWVAGAITRDEYRNEIGQDGCTDPVDGSVFYMPFNATLIPEGLGANLPVTAPALGSGDVPADPSTPNPQDDTSAKSRSYETRKSAVRGSADRYITPAETKLTEAMRSYFDSQGKRVAGAVRNGAKSWPAKAAEFDEDFEARKLEAFLIPLLSAGYLQGMAYVASLEGKITPTEVNPQGQANVNARAHTAAIWISATTAKAITRVIDAAQSAGESIAQLLAALAEVFASASDVRAPLIGRQETSTMFHTATLQDSRDAGFAGAIWVTVNDSKVDAVCAANEAEGPKPLGTVFLSGDSAPPIHWNCRCVLLPLTAAEMAQAA